MQINDVDISWCLCVHIQQQSNICDLNDIVMIAILFHWFSELMDMIQNASTVKQSCRQQIYFCAYVQNLLLKINQLSNSTALLRSRNI